MKKLLVAFALLLGLSASGQGYKNPIIPGYHPDPSVCRVGNDYYLVNSTFCYFPGVPVFHSRDLIHWEQIGNCLARPGEIPLDGDITTYGIYAPTIRYHEGTFYMITTNMSGTGNFIVTATDPAGPWSAPIRLKQGGIDPSLFFEDGKCYMASTAGGCCGLSEIDPKTGEQLTPTRLVWDGTGGRYPEGPHIYKKDGWYYLLAAEGGTEYGHKVTIARSRNIYGPYMENPANPILTHINRNAQTNPIQGTGHADIIQAHDGSWWIVFLGFRPQAGLHHLLGRETFLAPVTWEKNAWPVVNGDGTASLDMDCPTLSQHPFPEKPVRTRFDGEAFGPEWLFIRNPQMDNYQFTGESLRLKGTKETLAGKGSPTFVGRRQEHIRFVATTALTASSSPAGSEAGLTVFMNSDSHYDIFLRNGKGGSRSLVVRYRMGELTHTAAEVAVPKGEIRLRAEGTEKFYTLSYATEKGDFKELGKMDTRYLSTETAGGFTGVILGLFATSPQGGVSTAEFSYFDYEY